MAALARCSWASFNQFSPNAIAIAPKIDLTLVPEDSYRLEAPASLSEQSGGVTDDEIGSNAFAATERKLNRFSEVEPASDRLSGRAWAPLSCPDP